MSSKETEKIASFLKSHRKNANLSQRDVSDKLGYSSPQFISNWECGISQPSLNVMKKLAEMYKIDPDELFALMLEFQQVRLKKALHRKFYGV